MKRMKTNFVAFKKRICKRTFIKEICALILQSFKYLGKQDTRGFTTSDVESVRGETVFDDASTRSFIKCSTTYLFQASWCFPLA